MAIYIRWSTDDQGDGTTLDVQLDGCRHYVLSQGWQTNPALTFVDDGYSGGNLDRPAMGRLRALVAQGQIDCVVVFKVDRLSRSVVDTVNLVLEEWDGRTFLKSAREPIDTTTAMGKQFFYMLVSYAEWERSVIRERTVAGRRRRAAEGYKPSAIAPYGYQHAGGRRGALEVVPAEAEVVREIFRLCTAGLGTKAIAAALNSAGTPYRGGGLWSDKTVLYMLRNPAYAGEMVYGKTARNPRYGKAPGEPALLRAEPVVVPDSAFIPPIITQEELAQAGAMLASRRKGPGKPSGRANASPYLLSGLVRCRCGSGLYGRQQTGTGRRAPAYQYICLGKRLRGSQKCDCAPIPMAVLDAEIERRVRERYAGAETLTVFRRRMAAGRLAERRLREAEQAGADRRLGELEAQAQKVRRDYLADRISAAEYRELKQTIAREAHGLGARRAELAALLARAREETGAVQADRDSDVQAAQDSGAQAARDGGAPWDALETSEKKRILRFFIDRLVAYRRPGDSVIELELTWTSGRNPGRVEPGAKNPPS